MHKLIRLQCLSSVCTRSISQCSKLQQNSSSEASSSLQQNPSSEALSSSLQQNSSTETLSSILQQNSSNEALSRSKELYYHELKNSLKQKDYFDVKSLVTIKDLFDANVHLGHKKGLLNPQNLPYIYGARFDQCIIDLRQTLFNLRIALNFTAQMAFRDAVILFICRNPRYQYLVEKTAEECKEYSACHRMDMNILIDPKSYYGYTVRKPDLIIFLDCMENTFANHPAVEVAAEMLIPTVGIVDTNVNPTLVTYPVPGNDDSPSAIELYCNLFKKVILKAKRKKESICPDLD